MPVGLWGHLEKIMLLSNFLPIVDTCMPQLRRYSSTKLCDGAHMAILATFCVLYFQPANLCPPCVIGQAIYIFIMSFVLLSLWSPYGIGHTIIFSSCRLFFVLLLLFSSPNLSRRDLECRSEMCCTWLARNT